MLALENGSGLAKAAKEAKEPKPRGGGEPICGAGKTYFRPVCPHEKPVAFPYIVCKSNRPRESP